MNDRILSVFTPSRTAPEDLESIFVQRQALLADAVERVHESATTGHKHHLLFVGPRGTGKTHLVTLLAYRLSLDAALMTRLRIAWLNEDETSTTLLEFLRRIYLALAKRYPDELSAAALEPIYDLDAEAAETRLGTLLLESLRDRTLLVIVENLDALFEGLGDAGQQRLRAFIQEHPVVTIVATAQRLVDDLTKRSKVFFGFFQTELLRTLSIEDAAELLGKIAAWDKQPDTAAFLRGPTGRSRIRALHHLSGGNHRIYIVLSQFITRDNVDTLVVPFAKMLDEMTPYYQERIRWLPAQQRKIVEYLCSCERPVPVKDLARRLFATPQTISSQLKDLREKGYVQSAQRGRESLYEIAEPLMRLCVEVKENQSYEPMRLLVDFLRVWYDGRDLSSRLQGSLVVIHIATGRWDSALSTLAEGLSQGFNEENPYAGDSAGIITAFFASTLTPSIRRDRIRALAHIYRDHNAIPSLGEALTRHLGALYRAEELPSADNLELWASAWEDAGRDIDAFRLALRIFRTGIDFLKAGGKDRTILLDLNQEERRILEQVFALDGEDSL